MSTDSDEDAYKILTRKIVDDARTKAANRWQKNLEDLEKVLSACRLDYVGDKLELNNGHQISCVTLVDGLRNHFIKFETREIANKMAENIVRNYSDETADTWNE